MISTARVRFVRMSPRKIRYVLDLVRAKPVPAAFSILDRTSRRASALVRKLLLQAVDSAAKLHKVPAESLFVSKIFADGAGMMKRFRSMSMGRAGMIRKRLSHVTLELDTRPGVAVPAAAGEAPKRHTAKPESKPHRGAKTSGASRGKPTKKLAGAK